MPGAFSYAVCLCEIESKVIVWSAASHPSRFLATYCPLTGVMGFHYKPFLVYYSLYCLNLIILPTYPGPTRPCFLCFLVLAFDFTALPPYFFSAFQTTRPKCVLRLKHPPCCLPTVDNMWHSLSLPDRLAGVLPLSHYYIPSSGQTYLLRIVSTPAI